MFPNEQQHNHNTLKMYLPQLLIETRWRREWLVVTAPRSTGQENMRTPLLCILEPINIVVDWLRNHFQTKYPIWTSTPSLYCRMDPEKCFFGVTAFYDKKSMSGYYFLFEKNQRLRHELLHMSELRLDGHPSRFSYRWRWRMFSAGWLAGWLTAFLSHSFTDF